MLSLFQNDCDVCCECGVHVIHRDIVLSENKTCVLSLGTNFVPASCKAKQRILSDEL